MPARSNIFQRLVKEIHKELFEGWEITESKMLTDIRTGKNREVDIVAESLVGGYPIIISIEVRDHKRAGDVNWIENMAQKHADLPTNKLILWSEKGFSKSANKKADSLGITLKKPSSLDEAPWAEIARKVIDCSVKVLTPIFHPFVDVELSNGQKIRWDAPKSMLLKQKDGNAEISIETILNQMYDSKDLRTTLLDHAPEGTGSFWSTYDPGFKCNVIGPDGEIGELIRLIIDISTNCEVEPTQTRSAFHDGIATTLIEANDISLVVRESKK